MIVLDTDVQVFHFKQCHQSCSVHTTLKRASIHFQVVMPAKAGIQYAAALHFDLRRSGILGPRFRGDDIQKLR
jgi:hypothetical protein